MLIHVLMGIVIGLSVFFYRWRRKSREEFMGLMIALSSLMEMKDRYTEGHCARVRNRVSLIGEKLRLGRNEIEDIIMAATLHDVGKVGIPDEILKKSERLSMDEYERIKNHPKLGSDSLRSLPRLRNVARLIRHHHERYDGTGYPDGLKGEEIPLGSRIIAVIDSYDAMMSDRAYRKAFEIEGALESLRRNQGTQFDPRIVDIFLELAGRGQEKGIDPVCGMPGDEKKALVWEGEAFIFCSDACKEEFRSNPSKYARILGREKINLVTEGGENP